MCIVLVLLLNTFYKIYYRLFDLCEHVAAMITFLIFLGLMVGTIILSTNSSNQPRPLLTIAILVFGVLGGLAVVITVVYFYKLCLKRRAPITTTGKPDQKRSQIRSLVSNQCRNLTTNQSQYIQFDKKYYNSLSNTQYIVPNLVVSEVISDDEKYFHNSSNNKIRYTLTKNSRNLSNESHICNEIKLNRCGSQQHYNNNNINKYLPQEVIINNENTNNFLKPDNNFNSNGRTKSAEMLLNVQANDEIRRASTGSMYHPVNGIVGQRRRLPSIANIQPIPNVEYYNSNNLNIQNRKLYGLSRSQAIDNRDIPLKQSSSPLPCQREKIYTRQHAFSKSWNNDDHYYINDYSLQSTSIQNRPKYIENENFVQNYYQEKNQHIITPTINVIPPHKSNRNHYNSKKLNTNDVYPSNNRKNHYPLYDIPKYNYQNYHTYNKFNLPTKIDGYPKNKAISFDEKTALLYEKKYNKTPNYTNPPYRTLSEADKKNLIRQQTIQLLQPDSVVSKQCLDVWKDRKNFETDTIYLNQLSTDLSDDNSISTSFESNSESPTKDKRGHFTSIIPKSSEGANIKRQKFRDIMLKRQLLDDLTTGVETSSYDSSFDNPSNILESEKLGENDKNCYNNFNDERDYSIDSKSDTLFRLFSLNDPKYMFKGVINKSLQCNIKENYKSFYEDDVLLDFNYPLQNKEIEVNEVVNIFSYDQCTVTPLQEEKNSTATGDDNRQTKNRQIFWQYKRVSSKEDSDAT
ncbi:Hypothetical protein SRAE_X000116500 [Strongyloides ratti]|uniref:Uncharacterized protein n=1 Tax=Strongyloides ratti TaxID=34506 RepID=A0A090KVX5_STRRB|nr:Hypothetical protein SRAE_X000116500 [Strongyloides ratti]CEF59417.1 Hypothetical protein SRAE_X000116500 [Strongyloides ratti]